MELLFFVNIFLQRFCPYPHQNLRPKITRNEFVFCYKYEKAYAKF